MQWTYTKPTEEGHYLINYGDVVTDANMHAAYFKTVNGELVDIHGDNKALAGYCSQYKYLKLDTHHLNLLANEG